MKVTFLVETSGDSFANWLEYHTVMDQEDGKLEFPTEKGPIVLRPAIGPSHITYPTEINMWVVSQERPTPVGISFFLVPLVPDRVEVTAECHLSEVMDYFKDLLREIGKRWPETKEWLGVTIGQVLPDDYPKKDHTVKRYKRAYDIILQTRKRFYDCWKEGDFDNPTPKAQDYKDALAYHMGWKPCDKTLRKIIRLGDDGYVK